MHGWYPNAFTRVLACMLPIHVFTKRKLPIDVFTKRTLLRSGRFYKADIFTKCTSVSAAAARQPY